jgi:fatty-acyl-CoA synthase
MIHGDLLGERARLTPAKLAVVDVATGARLSYGELDARAAACAGALRHGLGLARGDRVGVLAGNRLEYLDLFYAAGKSGLVLVPVGTRLTAHEIAHIVGDSGMRGLIYDGAFLDTVRALREVVRVEHWIAIDGPAGPGDLRLPDAIRAAAGADRSTRERCGPDDLYALLYTSGTTGRPKGVMVPHRMVSWNAYNTVACWQLREDDVSPVFTPLYHAGALGAFLLPIVAIGGTIVLHAGFETTEVWDAIVRERCTVVLGVPTIWKMLLEAPEFATADLSHVRWFISGGAPLPEYIAAAFEARGVVFKQGYGLTEVGVNCFSMTVEESARKRGSIGKPLMMTEARLAGEQGADAAAGEVGELWLRGPHVSLGYWKSPEATRAALDAEGWFHTGDLARRDDEGFYYIAGRQKDMFISGGVNVYPAEIEAELLQHAAIADAAVIGVPHATWGEVGVAFVVLRPGEPLDPAQLAAQLERRLARYKIPRDFVALDALPRTAYGKVQKGVLQEAYAVRARQAPSLPTEIS